MKQNKQIEIFKALSEINRIRILIMLMHKSLCVCELTEILQLSASTVSKHLSILNNVGFIIYEKDGKWINYRINYECENEIVKNVLKHLSGWFENDDIFKQDLNKIKSIDRNVLCGVSKDL